MRLPNRFRMGLSVNRGDSKRYRFRQASAMSSISVPSKRLGRERFFEKKSSMLIMAPCRKPNRMRMWKNSAKVIAGRLALKIGIIGRRSNQWRSFPPYP
jgi:hypothetical protein